MSTASLTARTPLETGERIGTAETTAAPTASGPSAPQAQQPSGTSPTQTPPTGNLSAPGASTASTAPTAPPETYRGFSLASFVLGIASVVSGWTLFAPVVGLVLGAIALRRGTSERTFALWGVWLNAIMLGLAVLAATVAVIAFGVFGAFTLPFWDL